MSTLTAGKIAPAFKLIATDGKAHALQEALGHGPLILAFFKVSCPTCQYTFPFVERIYQQLRTQGAQVWGIAQDETDASREFAKEYGISFPILVDDYPYELSREYKLKYVPTLFLIAPDGHIEISSEGFTKADLLQIQKSLAKRFSATPGELFPPRDNVPEYKPG